MPRVVTTGQRIRVAAGIRPRRQVKPVPFVRPILAFILVLASVAPAGACLWDYDTPRLERRAPPGVLELIVGKSLRHSDAFYEWRVEDRSAKIAAHDAGKISLDDNNLAAAYDDWAVALDKLNRHEKAIEVINEKSERLPEAGQYQTHANRGTFLIHTGRLEEGVAELKKATATNPGADSERDEYHVLLVEYLIERRGGAEQVSLPLDDSQRRGGRTGGPFARWLLERRGLAGGGDSRAFSAELDQAIEGVAGVMRFGNHQSPILLEALGDLLSARDGDPRIQRLAARAYLTAAMEVERESARRAFREMAREVLRPRMSKTSADDDTDREDWSLKRLEDQLARERKEASTWFERVRHDEALWIAESTDPTPDERFWQKYGTQTIEVGRARIPPARFAATGLPWPIQAAMGAIALLTAAVVAGLLFWRRRRPTGYE